MTSAMIENVIADLLSVRTSNSPACRATLQAEMEANSELLHDAHNYVEYQNHIERDIRRNDDPGHEVCIAIQAGFLLGLRCARKGLQ